jgi:hypothetical protein
VRVEELDTDVHALDHWYIGDVYVEDERQLSRMFEKKYSKSRR